MLGLSFHISLNSQAGTFLRQKSRNSSGVAFIDEDGDITAFINEDDLQIFYNTLSCRI
jgi:hypothetical protein